MHRLLFSIFIFLSCFSSAKEANRIGKAHYLGNEGVMVATAEGKVLFDPLFKSGFDIFELVPQEIKHSIYKNQAPFNNIDVILVSHYHGDHFNGQMVLDYLLRYSSVQLVAPKQVMAEILALPKAAKITKQLHAISLEIGEAAKSLTINNIDIEAIRVPHVGWPQRTEIENVIYRVNFADASVMHFGDTDPNLNHFQPFKHFFSKQKSSLTFLPGIFAKPELSQTKLKSTFNSESITYVHIPMQVPSELKALGVDYFSKPSEIRDLVAVD